MPYVKRMVCLANSYKAPDGRCIAGREMLGDRFSGWIRPVSARETAEVSFWECRYENQTIPKLLDIIDVRLVRPEPRHHQTENHIIAAGLWTKAGELPWKRLEELLDHPASLWINSDSTSAGAHDRMSQSEAASVNHSLMLIRPERFCVVVGRNDQTGRKSFRGDFSYNRTHHNLSVTDPIVRDAFGSKEEGRYPLTDVYLCVSLTEPYEHDCKCYKLVAAVLSERPLG